MRPLHYVWIMRRYRRGGPVLTCRVYRRRRRAVSYALKAIRWHEVEEVCLKQDGSTAQTVIKPAGKVGA